MTKEKVLFKETQNMNERKNSNKGIAMIKILQISSYEMIRSFCRHFSRDTKGTAES